MKLKLICEKCNAESPTLDNHNIDERIQREKMIGRWLIFRRGPYPAFYCPDCSPDPVYNYKIETKVDGVWYDSCLLEFGIDSETAESLFKKNSAINQGIQLVQTSDNGRTKNITIIKQKIVL